MRPIVTIFFIFLITIPVGFAAIYEWTNDEGNIAYTQTPPKNRSIPTKKISVRSSQPIEHSPSSTQDQHNPPVATGEPSPESLSQSKKDGAKLLQLQCANAKKALSNLSLGGTRLYKDSDGNYLRLNEKEKMKRSSNLNEFIKEHCGKL